MTSGSGVSSGAGVCSGCAVAVGSGAGVSSGAEVSSGAGVSSTADVSSGAGVSDGSSLNPGELSTTSISGVSSGLASVSSPASKSEASAKVGNAESSISANKSARILFILLPPLSSSSRPRPFRTRYRRAHQYPSGYGSQAGSFCPPLSGS